MKILTKLATALRGGLTEAGEAAVRTQSGRILDQEIRDADTAINESNSRLADTMADRADANRRIAKLQADISQYEGHANTALDKGKDELAGEIAAKIAEAEAQLNQEQQVAERLETAISSLHARIRESKHAIRVIKNKRKRRKSDRPGPQGHHGRRTIRRRLRQRHRPRRADAPRYRTAGTARRRPRPGSPPAPRPGHRCRP